ncbi:Sentrin-specific protease 3 [Folsomia candida]|uniref:Sentrin-specific protease 3 n=1 Tax=Folsomia candida TaxID=158441 RepID=A0A226DIF4_FOLCA|nr:Sentrin-specific protease 3 [Folsomia candida]
MEGFKPLFKKFCKTRDSKVEKEIINIVKNRQASALAATYFYELTAEVRDLLNSDDCKIVSHLFLLLQQICEEAVEETADILQIIDQTYTNNLATYISKTKLSELKEKDFKELKLVDPPQEEKFELKENESQCPKCNAVVKFDAELGGFHVSCEPCDYIFCSNCRSPFHGFVDCETNSDKSCNPSTSSDADKNLSVDVRNKSAIKDFQLVRQSSGADAMDHEASFYENPINKTLTREEVNPAFDFEAESIPEKEWPWEKEKHTFTKIYKYPKYKSLEPNTWVEDELLENAIKITLEKENLTDTHTVLETFVIKYGSLKSDDDKQLIGMLSDKKIPSKKIVLALINTDFDNHGGHWLLGCVEIEKKKIIFFDSSIVMSPTFYRRPFFVLLKLLQVAYELEKEPFDPNKWKLIVALNSVQQNNDYDCGPMVVCNAYAISQGAIIRKVPSSKLVREWLLDVLLEASEKAKGDKGEVEKATDPWAVTREEKVAEFSPKHLKIEFAFIPSSHFL